MRQINPASDVIVVVEDNPDNMLVLEYDLADLGAANLLLFDSGLHFFRYLRQHPDVRVDLVFLDIQLPGEDGYKLLAQMRALPELADVVLVATTANVMSKDVERAQAAGFDHFIGKPYRRLADQLARICAGQRVWEPR